MSKRLEGKVAVITGAASGIGAATAKTYVEQGAKVVLGDIQDDAGAALVEALGGTEHAVFCHCNVTSEAEVQALVDTAVSTFGQIDVMFNCAGIVGAVGPMSTTPADEWKLTIDIMVNGVFYGMKHASRHMKEAGSGSIITMSITAGVMGGLGPHAYATAKHAVVGMTKNLASPLKGRAGLAQDVANAALWLASDESGYTSGLTLTVDAGATTGSTPEGPSFAEYQPMMREAGRTGLD